MVIQFKNLMVVLEFKYVPKSSDVDTKMSEGKSQTADREYTKSYCTVSAKSNVSGVRSRRRKAAGSLRDCAVSLR